MAAPEAPKNTVTVALPPNVPTPTGTMQITLVQERPPTIDFWENPANLLPLAALLGALISVGLTIRFGWKKMKYELTEAASQAGIERDLTREQAMVEREQTREQAKLDREDAANEAHKERITIARRELYVELIGEMTTVTTAVANLPAQDVGNLDIQSGLNGLLTVAAKIMVVGEMDTVIKSRKLVIAINEGLFRLLPLLFPIHLEKMEAELMQSRHKETVMKADAWSEKLLEAHRTNAEEDHIKSLKGLIDLALKDADRFDGARLGAELNKQKAAQRFHEEMMNEISIVNDHVNDLVVSMRSELNLETSLIDLTDISDRMHHSAVASLARLREQANAV